MFRPCFLRLLRPLLPDMTWEMADRSSVYLTFDDGPTPGITEWILKTLAGYGVRATFFCLGKNVEQHPDLYRAIADAGHKVGNHSYSHIKGRGMATGQYVADVDLANQLVESDIFRPPYGRIRRRQAEVLSERYRLVMGGIVSQDYSPSVTPQECLRNVTRYVDGGSIVVFHDSAKAFRNTEYALPRAIEYIAEAGFRFGTIGAAAEPVGPAAKGLHRPDGHRIEAEHPPLVGAGGLSGRY